MRHIWAVLLLTLAAPVKGEAARYVMGCDDAACVVAPWDAPEAAPFRHLGVTLESDRPPLTRWDKWRYRRSLARFDTPEACLRQGSATARGSDLALIDWARVNTRLKAEVCLFRLHSAMRDVERSKLWFELQGYHTYMRRNPPGHFRAGQTVLFADWRQDQRAPFDALAFPLKRQPYDIAIRQSPEGEVLEINIWMDIK